MPFLQAEVRSLEEERGPAWDRQAVPAELPGLEAELCSLTCLIELIGLDKLLGTGQGGTVLSLVLQELQQLRGAQHMVLTRVPVENGLQFGAFQQPPQECLNLSPLQTLVVGMVTLLGSGGVGLRGGDTLGNLALTDTLHELKSCKSSNPYFPRLRP